MCVCVCVCVCVCLGGVRYRSTWSYPLTALHTSQHKLFTQFPSAQSCIRGSCHAYKPLSEGKEKSETCLLRGFFLFFFLFFIQTISQFWCNMCNSRYWAEKQDRKKKKLSLSDIRHFKVLCLVQLKLM